MVNLTMANVSDSAGAQIIIEAIRKRWPWIKHVFAGGPYDLSNSWTRPPSSTSSSSSLKESIQALYFYRGDVGRSQRLLRAKLDGVANGGVERTFAWPTRYRRLVRDDEARTDTSEAMIELAMTGLLIR